MNKRVVQLDAYDEVELWVAGVLQMKIKFDNGRLVELSHGTMALKPYEPGIIHALKEEGIYDGE
jgi:hypothetical protein